MNSPCHAYSISTKTTGRNVGSFVELRLAVEGDGLYPALLDGRPIRITKCAADGLEEPGAFPT